MCDVCYIVHIISEYICAHARISSAIGKIGTMRDVVMLSQQFYVFSDCGDMLPNETSQFLLHV